MNDKRGITTVGMIASIVLALALIVGVGYFIYQASVTVDETMKTVAIDDFDVKYAPCTLGYDPLLKNSFCTKFDSITVKGIGGKEAYVSCQSPMIVERLSDDGIVKSSASKTSEQILEEFCGKSVEVLAQEQCAILVGDNDFPSAGVWINELIFEDKADCSKFEMATTEIVGGADGNGDETPDDEVVTCESQKGQWKPECSQIDIDLVESGDVTEVHVDGWKCCAA